MMDEKVQEHADIRDAYKDVALKVTPDLGIPKLTNFDMVITDGKKIREVGPKDSGQTFISTIDQINTLARVEHPIRYLGE